MQGHAVQVGTGKLGRLWPFSHRYSKHKFFLVSACWYKFCLGAQGGSSVSCYYKILLPEAQIASLGPWGVCLCSFCSKSGCMGCHHPSTARYTCWSLSGCFSLCGWSLLYGLYIWFWRMMRLAQCRFFLRSWFSLSLHRLRFGWCVYRVSLPFVGSCRCLGFCSGLC